MTLGGPELAFMLLFFGLPLWGIIDAAIRPDTQWQQASQSKLVWVILQIFLGIIGAIIYLSAIRPKLKRVAG